MSSFQDAGQSTRNTNKHDIRGNKAHESLVQGNLQASPATGLDSTTFEDSGFFEDDETNPRTNRHDYKDWILYNNDLPALNTDDFFADLDASTKANHSSIYDGTNNESTTYIERSCVYDAQEDKFRRTNIYDSVYEAVHEWVDQSIYEAINDFDIRSQPDYSRPSHDPTVLSPLEKWANAYERHESIAYRSEQPTNAARQSHRPAARQSSSRSGNGARSH